MGEIKSVKVDNWGVFFLQKLQNFFNKTDYCDLTLQFRDNSQLKVHRLVLSACTDYFNVLENTCEVIDDALIMPNELQADVVVPIVNFMYTGTLEFELRMYGKLLRTAKEMNMTVLLKLLEAHRRTMEGVNRSQRPQTTTTTSSHPSVPGRRIVSQAGSPASAQQQPAPPHHQMPQRRIVQAKTAATNTVQTPIRQVGQTTLIRTTVTGSGNSLLKQETAGASSPSTFEQLRKGYNNNKRPAPTNFVSPPSKKPNIEDVKEFAEQQRMRKQIAAEYGDDPDYDMPMDDDIHADDDDDDGAMTSNNSLNASSSSQHAANKSLQQQQEVGETTITFKAEQGGKPPTIVVKDSSNSKMNHAKIISEVLRQYPHLAKGNKNIKLKIMSTAGGQAQKIIVKREVASEGTESPAIQSPAPVAAKPPATPLQTRVVEKASPQLQQRPVPQQKVVAAAGGKPAATIAPQAMHTTPSTGTPAKRRIDSKTMHALIALGAENTTGPWLCLRCGVNGRPISIPTYRGFRRHLVNTHKETIDPALCENCGKRSNSNREQHFHNQVEHNMRSNLYTYPECLLCSELFLDNNALNEHMMTSHPDANNQQCIYCNKIFGEEEQLLAHMKAYHKRQAMADGIVDCEDDSLAGSQDENDYESSPKAKNSGVKILSNITLPHNSTLVKMGGGARSSEAAALSTVASGIATSIAITSSDGTEEFISAVESEQQGGTVTKFVNADGNEMVLTDELRKEIMSQLNQEHEVGAGGVVMVLNETAFGADEATQETAGSEVEEHQHEQPDEGEEAVLELGEHDSSMDESEATAGELRSATTADDDEEEYDDSQIYGEFLTQEPQAEQKAAVAKQEALDESKSSVENMEWAESLLSAHEAEEAKTEGEAKVVAAKNVVEKEDDISKKLKELTGDWSDDENDEEEAAAKEADEGETAPASVEAEEETQESVPADPLPAEELTVEEKAPEGEEQTVEEAVAEETTTKASPMEEEDDLELAMENLHKDDSVAEEKPSAAAEAVEEEAAEPQQVSAADDSQDPADLHAQLHEAPTTTTIEDTDPQQEEEEEVVAKPEEAAAVEDVTEEEEDAASTLLDKLVTEKAASVEAVDSTAAGEEKVEAATTEEASAELAETEEVKDEIKDEKDKSLEETPAEETVVEEEVVKEEEVADQEFLEEKAEAATTSASKEVVEGEVTEVASPEKAANTSDKMKSLISEWVDDDEEEEEEVADMEEI